MMYKVTGFLYIWEAINLQSDAYQDPLKSNRQSTAGPQTSAIILI
jgi:hypothetical protein